MDIIEKRFHVGLSSVNYFSGYILFNKGLIACDENIPSFGIRLCYKDIDYFLWFFLLFQII
jgi:hypothetical protein